jgi:hypothetical protein
MEAADGELGVFLGDQHADLISESEITWISMPSPPGI